MMDFAIGVNHVMVLELDKSNIANVIRLCNKNARMIATVYCDSNEELEECVDYLLAMDYLLARIEDIKGNVEKCRSTRGHNTVYFNNGSLIRLTVASDRARGYRNNLIVVSPNVDPEVFRTVIMPSYRVYIPEVFE